MRNHTEYYSPITLYAYMKKEQLLRRVFFFLLVTLLINVTGAFHFEENQEHNELLGTALPLLCLKPGVEESPPEWSVFDSGSDSARGGSAVGSGNILSLRTGAGPGLGTWGQEAPSPLTDLRSTLHPQVHSEGFLLLRSFLI